MEKTYSETEQNMSEKQGKGQIMLHLPMKFENHVMNRENEFLRSWSGMPLLSSKSVDENINNFFFLNWLPSGDRGENFFGNIISTRLKYTILKPKDIGK
jgi:hypothetical protein